MKNTGKDIRILAGLMTVLTAIVLILILQIFPDTASTQEVEAQYRYIYLAPVGEEKYFVEIAGGISAADEDTGTDTLLLRYEDEETLSACVGDALLAEVDGIIMKGASESAELVEMAAAYGVPVVYYDMDFADTGRAVYVGIDNYQAGMTAMCALAEALGGEGNVLLAVRSESAASQAERIQGCQAALNDYPDMAIAGILASGGNELYYKELLMETLEEDSSISAILCLDGISADATGKLLKDNGLDGTIAVAAFDLTEKTREYLEEGIYCLVIKQDAWQVGYEAVSQLNACMNRLEEETLETIQSEMLTVYLDVICVTGDTLEQYAYTQEEELEWDVY